MTVKKTIALIGTGRSGESHVDKLVNNYRLLTVMEDIRQNSALPHNKIQEEILSEVEIIDCAKEACWEADIIALFGPENIKRGLIQQIKEVATQKTVVAFNEIHGTASAIANGYSTLRLLLPHSKVFWVVMDPSSRQALIEGNEEDASIVENLSHLLEYKPVILERKL
jgi:hypothetical protein